MKKCCKCKTFKEESEFGKNKRTTDGLQKCCKVCRKESDAAYYKRNPKKKREQNKKNENRNRKFIQKYKKENGCLICGYNCCTSALDFHHLDPTQKEKNIAAMVKDCCSIETIEVEIDKCVVLCRNHHAELHDGLIDLNDYMDN